MLLMSPLIFCRCLYLVSFTIYEAGSHEAVELFQNYLCDFVNQQQEDSNEELTAKGFCALRECVFFFFFCCVISCHN